jgi:hypothetical protein
MSSFFFLFFFEDCQVPKQLENPRFKELEFPLPFRDIPRNQTGINVVTVDPKKKKKHFEVREMNIQ